MNAVNVKLRVCNPRYHRSEILATILNEYTDWERPVQHPVNLRDETLEALSDAQVVAPVVLTADVHSSTVSNKSFFYVFDYQTKYGDYQQVSRGLLQHHHCFIVRIVDDSFKFSHNARTGRRTRSTLWPTVACELLSPPIASLPCLIVCSFLYSAEINLSRISLRVFESFNWNP